jgi:hypothetical protein
MCYNEKKSTEKTNSLVKFKRTTSPLAELFFPLASSFSHRESGSRHRSLAASFSHGVSGSQHRSLAASSSILRTSSDRRLRPAGEYLCWGILPRVIIG